MPPQIVLPLIAVVCGIAAVIGEAVFLAPVMDGFGIADATLQLIFAGVIVITTSGLFEITKRVYSARTSDHLAKDEQSTNGASKIAGLGGLIFLGVLTTLALVLVFILGWWRAEEMIYAAAVQPGPWKEFLANNTVLTRLVVVLLTTALPIFVAIAFEWGLNGLHLAWEWRKSRETYKHITKQLDSTQKELEQKIEGRDSRIRELEQMREEWKQAYLQNHELGQKTGAWQTPLWRVVLKIAAVVLLVLTICLLLDPITAKYIESGWMRSLLYGCMTLGFGVLYASRAIKAWDRPTAGQLYDQKATIFRSESSENDARPFVISHSSPVEDNGKPPLGSPTEGRRQAATVG
jgi:ABC-type multidrug transport system fused ATPase/permease subunit